MRNLTSWLFETGAVAAAPYDKPFFYTSGQIGPYYINTHYLYGGEQAANELLALIDGMAGDRDNVAAAVTAATVKHYEAGGVYKQLIDGMCEYINQNIGSDFDYISGGERRDWFFSLIIARQLGKEHLTIFKDLEVRAASTGKKNAPLNGASVLHISDIITTASSYTRAWIPAIAAAGGRMAYSLSVLDRGQGGGAAIEDGGARSYSVAPIDKVLFDRALSDGYIDAGQHRMIVSYTENPDGYVRDFIADNPDFLQNALNSADQKTAGRARLLNDWLQTHR